MNGGSRDRGRLCYDRLLFYPQNVFGVETWFLLPPGIHPPFADLLQRPGCRNINFIPIFEDCLVSTLSRILALFARFVVGSIFLVDAEPIMCDGSSRAQPSTFEGAGEWFELGLQLGSVSKWIRDGDQQHFSAPK